MKRLLLCIALVPLFSGCAALTRQNEDRYSQRCAAWVGRSVNDLIDSMGAPGQTFQKPDGEMIYIWNVQGRTVAHTSYFGSNAVTTARQRACSTSFIIDKSGLIKSWRWNGDCGQMI